MRKWLIITLLMIAVPSLIMAGIGGRGPQRSVDLKALDTSVVFKTTTVTAAGPTDNVNVADVNIVFINTNSNNVAIGGFIGGVSGQSLLIIIIDASNNATLEHAESTGNQDVYLSDATDETITAGYGGWVLTCNGTHWYEGSVGAPAGAGAAWGSITGTLSNQSDLNTALGNKLDDTQLDDTKGNGDTGYMWSADKIFDQLTLQLLITQIGAAYDTEAELLALFNARCLESMFGDAKEADDLELSGTTLQLVAEIPHIDAPETITGNWELPWLNIDKRASAPGSPVAGQIYYANNDPWDPAGFGGSLAYYVIYDGANYIPLFDEDGDWYLNKIQAAMNVIADADGIILTTAQMNSVIFMTGAGEVVIPDAMCETATGAWVTVKASAAHQVEMVCEADEAFILSDGTDCGNGDEADLVNAAGAQVTFMCLNAKEWWVTGEIGTVTDGGAPD